MYRSKQCPTNGIVTIQAQTWRDGCMDGWKNGWMDEGTCE